MAKTEHADAGRKGKAVEQLVAASCVLGSKGQLNAWTSLVDDEGVDLVFQRRGSSKTLSVQVKARLTTAKGLAERQKFQSQVRKVTLRPRTDLYMLFVVANPTALELGPIWLIPSRSFAKRAPLSPKGKHKFVASAKTGTKDQWSRYLVERTALPMKLVEILKRIES